MQQMNRKTPEQPAPNTRAFRAFHARKSLSRQQRAMGICRARSDARLEPDLFRNPSAVLVALVASALERRQIPERASGQRYDYRIGSDFSKS